MKILNTMKKALSSPLASRLFNAVFSRPVLAAAVIAGAALAFGQASGYIGSEHALSAMLFCLGYAYIHVSVNVVRLALVRSA